MITASTNLLTLKPVRGQTFTASVSSLDFNGNKPSNLATTNNIHYISYWRDLNGKIYDSFATESDNEFDFSIPAIYMNPANENISIACYWVDEDGAEQLFAIITCPIHDQPSGVFASSSIGFSYPNQAQIAFMPQVHYVNGHKIQVKITQTGVAPNEGGDVNVSLYADAILSALTLLSISAEVAADGADVIVEIYKDDVATGTTITLPAGRTMPLTQSINIGV